MSRSNCRSVPSVPFPNWIGSRYGVRDNYHEISHVWYCCVYHWFANTCNFVHTEAWFERLVSCHLVLICVDVPMLSYFRGIRVVVFNKEIYLDVNNAQKATCQMSVPLVELRWCVLAPYLPFFSWVQTRVTLSSTVLECGQRGVFDFLHHNIMLILSPNRCIWRHFAACACIPSWGIYSRGLLELELICFPMGDMLLFALSNTVEGKWAEVIGRLDFIFRRC